MIVSGRANVFEAWVGVHVLNAVGRRIASTYTIATCGSGCWGHFSVEVSYRIERDQPGTVIVFDDNAGAPSEGHHHEVRIPVRLEAHSAPSGAGTP